VTNTTPPSSLGRRGSYGRDHVARERRGGGEGFPRWSALAPPKGGVNPRLPAEALSVRQAGLAQAGESALACRPD